MQYFLVRTEEALMVLMCLCVMVLMCLCLCLVSWQMTATNFAQLELKEKQNFNF